MIRSIPSHVAGQVIVFELIEEQYFDSRCDSLDEKERDGP